MMNNFTIILLQLTSRAVLCLIIAFLLIASTFASGQAQLVPGNDGGLFVVKDALIQFKSLKHHGEAIGWINDEDNGAIDPSSSDHYQGLARYPGDNVPLFYVTQKDDDDDGKKGGYLHVVVFGSRPMTGERLRSNLMKKGVDTEDTYPPLTDTWDYLIRFDGSFQIDGVTIPAYVHPGGMAIVDDILFVPLDTPASDSDPTGQILLFDLANDPTRPIPIQAIELDHQIDNLAVTKYGDDDYLVWINGGGGDVTKFYTTNTSDLRDPALGLLLKQDWIPGTDLQNGSWPGDSPSVPECAHQSSTFLRDVDGSLFMIAMRHGDRLSGAGICGSPSVGNDNADLYKVEIQNDRFTLIEKAKINLHCVYDGGGGPVDMRICNFGAASTAYVTPSGELILYSVPHDDEDGFDPDIVRMGEFRHRDVNRFGTCTWGTAWAELYDDDGFEDRSIMFDWEDRNKDNFDNFNFHDGFNDKTSSVRWCVMEGCSIKLYQHDNYGGDSLTLNGSNGSGTVREIGNLNSFGDETSSIEFAGICSNEPPVCNANGPYQKECEGSATELTLDGTGSSDPNPGETITYTWSTTCPGTGFADPTASMPELTVDSSSAVTVVCDASLIVTDEGGLSDSCSNTVTVVDTTPPSITCPSNVTVECDQSTDPFATGTASASDVCDSGPSITFSDTVVPGTCPEESTITRTWTATDESGNSNSCVQTIEVVDTTPPDIQCNAPATITPPDAPISFTATVTDNCAGDPSVEIIGYDCFKYTKKGERIDNTKSCIVEMNGDTITILNSGGVDDNITWTVRANDNCGNMAESTCSVIVVKPKKP